MKRLLILSLLFSWWQASSQPASPKDVELTILNDSIELDSTHMKVSIGYTLKNILGGKVILYRLGSKMVPFDSRKVDLLCDQEKTGAGIIFQIVDEQFKVKTARSWHISDFSTPVNKERFDSLMNLASVNSLKSTIVLNTGEARTFEQEIDLSAFSLTKGRYYLLLAYYAGKRIDHFVGEEQLLTDKETYKADVYQGCVISERVMFTVN